MLLDCLFETSMLEHSYPCTAQVALSQVQTSIHTKYPTSKVFSPWLHSKSLYLCFISVLFYFKQNDGSWHNFLPTTQYRLSAYILLHQCSDADHWNWTIEQFTDWRWDHCVESVDQWVVSCLLSYTYCTELFIGKESFWSLNPFSNSV